MWKTASLRLLLPPAVLLSGACRSTDGAGVSGLPAVGNTQGMPPPWGSLCFTIDRVEFRDGTVADVCGYLLRKTSVCSIDTKSWKMVLTPAHPDARVTLIMKNVWFTDCLRELIKRGGPVRIAFEWE